MLLKCPQTCTIDDSPNSASRATFCSLFSKSFQRATACALGTFGPQGTSSRMDSFCLPVQTPCCCFYLVVVFSLGWGGCGLQRQSRSESAKQTRGKRRRCGFPISEFREVLYLPYGMLSTGIKTVTGWSSLKNGRPRKKIQPRKITDVLEIWLYRRG